ncbi:MAG: hypothetical protein Q8P62_04075 [Candidatus Peregrinibacteria bacterium]|nr:hypothetical protein [Candidatus Peregrinibacteria bacterium]
METKNIQDEGVVQKKTTRKLQIGVTAEASATKYAERTEQLAEETRRCLGENDVVLIEGISSMDDVRRCDGLIKIVGGAEKWRLGSEIAVIYDADKAEMRKNSSVIFYLDTEDTEYPENQIADVAGARCWMRESADTPQEAVELILRRIGEIAILDPK